MRSRTKQNVSPVRLAPAARRAAAVLIEPVERRTMMSASLANGVLTVAGTAAADTITVTLVGISPNSTSSSPAAHIDVVVNGTAQTFPAASVSGVVVSGGDGGDAIDVTESPYDIQDADFSAFAKDALSVGGGAGADNVAVDFGVLYGDPVATVAVDGGDDGDVIAYSGVTPATLHGGAGNDRLTATGDGLTVYPYGDAGNDTISATGDDGLEYAHMDGGTGDDSFSVDDSSRFATITGGAGTDTLVVPSYYDDDAYGSVLSLNAGQSNGNLNPDDTVEDVTDTNNQHSGHLTVIGNASANVLDFSGAQIDDGLTLEGAGGNDRLIGESTGEGNTLDGGDGNDTLVPGTAANAFIGGAGTDLADYSARTDDLYVYLEGGQGSGDAADRTDTFDGSVEQVYGGSGNDNLYGTAGNNALFGNGGNDTLHAFGGTDALFGGVGNDTIFCGDGGSTYVDGGAGTDTATTDATGDTTVNVETVHTVGGPAPLTGALIGTTGSNRNGGNTIAKAVDGNLNTFFDGAAANGNTVGYDLGTADTIASVSFAPRSGYASRMVGGIFQGSNSPQFTTGVTTLYTVSAAPAAGQLTTAAVTATGSYRYVRYLSPNGSYGNAAEVQFNGTAGASTPAAGQLSGTPIGTAGSYKNGGNTIAKATDGNLSTFFDGPTANGNSVGLDLGTQQSVDQLRFAPRSGYASRMVGGVFQASTSADFSSGVTTLYTVTAAPASGALSMVAVSPTVARYVRYLSPNGSEGDVAEVQFFE